MTQKTDKTKSIHKNNKRPRKSGGIYTFGTHITKNGADSRTRTGDPILTMDVLYLLS